MPRRCLNLAQFIVIACVAHTPLAASAPPSLAAVQAQIEAEHPRVAQIEGDSLASRLAQPALLLLLDVRETGEYAVSHLPGAIRVAPGASRRNILARHAAAARGKTVVLYCSVGVRSSKLAETVQDDLLRAGARAVYNLEGGIFAWHNARRPLVNARGPTGEVHPYDASWGTLLTRPAPARDTLRLPHP